MSLCRIKERDPFMDFKRKTIILADDDPTFTMILSVLLDRMGFQVIPVEKPKQALVWLRSMRPDIILLSSKPPHVDGLTTLRYIKESPKFGTIPVIMILEETEKEVREEFLRLGCSGILKKPIDLNELGSMIWNVIVLPGGRRRKALRVAFEKKIFVTYNGVTQGYYAVSLSEGGLYVRKRGRLPLGAQVQVALPLSDGSRMVLKGVVVNETELYGNFFKIVPGVTIDFIEMDPVNARKLRIFIIELLVGDLLEEQDGPYIAIHRGSSTSWIGKDPVELARRPT
jgi:CheY-like chemotaxis protein